MAKEVKAPKKQAKAKEAAPAATEAKAVTAAAVKTKPHRRVLVGTVLSDKMQKTLVVKVDRRVRHSLYKKYVLRSCKYKAHDEKNQAKVGDLVSIVESRPLSRDKRWALQSILRRASQTLDITV